MAPRDITFGLLGPLQVSVDGTEIHIAPKPRIVLAVLLLRANRLVTVTELIDAVWDEQHPVAARSVLHTYVSRIRAALGADGEARDDPIRTRPEGYVLRADRDHLDYLRFQEAVHRARAFAGDPRREDDALRSALALWRGEPLADVPSETLRRGEAVRLSEERLHVYEWSVLTRLQLGRHQDVIGELYVAIDENPFRERLTWLLMLALARSGRQADALNAYAAVRDRLARELGIDPSPELVETHRRILNRDPTLLAPTARTGTRTEPSTRCRQVVRPARLPPPRRRSSAASPSYGVSAT